MRKARENDHTIARMEVPELERKTIEERTRQIVDLGMPERRTFWAKVKETYVGPGPRVVFYHSKSSIALGVLLYPAILKLIFMVGTNSPYWEYVNLLAFPMLHLILLILTNWAEEDENMVEVKWGLPYTAAHMIGLRMFYISIATAVVNSFLFPVLYGETEIKVILMGVSSIFLFSIVMLLMVERVWSYYRMILLGVLWSMVWLVCAGTAGALKEFLFETIPLAVHAGIMAGCFVGMLIMIGKVGKKNAVAYKCS